MGEVQKVQEGWRGCGRVRDVVVKVMVVVVGRGAWWTKPPEAPLHITCLWHQPLDAGASEVIIRSCVHTERVQCKHTSYIYTHASCEHGRVKPHNALPCRRGLNITYDVMEVRVAKITSGAGPRSSKADPAPGENLNGASSSYENKNTAVCT